MDSREMFRRRAVLVCAVAFTTLLLQPVGAKPRDDDKEDAPKHEHRQPQSPAAIAARRAQDMNGGGRVLSAQRDGDDHGYNVKVLKKGEVRVIYVPDDPPK